MKFNEKLIELRKKQGLSQEELGYKLNVTRQTISKWELGQTTPEMDKLVEISKIFNITVDELINNSEETATINTVIEDQPIQDQPIKNDEKKEKKILIILVALLIVVIVAIGGITISSTKKAKAENGTKNILSQIFNESFDESSVEDEAKGFFEKLFSLIDKDMDIQLEMQDSQQDIQQSAQNIFENAMTQINTSSYNGAFEVYKGSNSGTQLKRFLDEVITTNKKYEKKITIKYLVTETQDTEEIQNMKLNIKDSNNFEITFDYDADGYINKATIQKVVSEFEKSSFNSGLEIHAGSTNGMIVTSVLDRIITSNKTKEEKITVKYKTTETQDENEIRNIKRNFGTFDNCEITYEYDENGFINKAIIEKR